MLSWLSSHMSALRRPFNAVAAKAKCYKDASRWFWKARGALKRLTVTGVTGSPFLFEVAPNPVIFSHLGTAGASAVISRFAHVPADLDGLDLGFGSEPVQWAVAEHDEIQERLKDSLIGIDRSLELVNEHSRQGDYRSNAGQELLRQSIEGLQESRKLIMALMRERTGSVPHNNRNCIDLVKWKTTTRNPEVVVRADGQRRHNTIAMAEKIRMDQDLHTDVADVVLGEQEDKTTQGPDLNAPKTSMDSDAIDHSIRIGPDEAPGMRERSANSNMATVPRSQNICPHCSINFPTPGLVQRHINRKHIRRFNCLEGSCDWAFNLKADLQRHQDTVHRSSLSAGGFTCANSWCKFPGKVWPRKDNFERHAKECKPGRHALKREKKKISSRRVRFRNV